MKKLLDRILGRSDLDLVNPGSSPEAAQELTQPFLPDGRRIYSIGDIHGRLDLLEELHEAIEQDASGFTGDKVLVYLGDYIDRGSQSKQVIDLLIEQPLAGFETVHLLGNHERTMLDFLDYPQEAAAWLSFGGQVTLLSYGVGLGRINMMNQLDVIRDELVAQLPAAHHDFLSNCRYSHTEGSYFFAHAGVRPGVALDYQVPEDLLWIRDEFTRSKADHGYIVVHGHSISEDVEWNYNRIGIDTGAYASGTLTALVLEGTEQRLIQTGKAVG